MITLVLHYPEGAPGRGRTEEIRTLPGLIPAIGASLNTSYGMFTVADLCYGVNGDALSEFVGVTLADRN